MQKLQPEQIEALYPVGTVYINATNSTNPATLFGFGTWEAWGVGKAIVGIDTDDTDFDTAELTGGSKTNDLTHNHLTTYGTDSSAIYGHGGNPYGSIVLSAGSARKAQSVSNTTGNVRVDYTANPTTSMAETNNLQPYQVGYVWKRTA